MNGFIKRLIFYNILFACNFLFVFCLSNVDLVKLNFDQPFFSTPFKKVFDSCMKVCQEVDFLKNYKCTKKDCEIITDLLVGKLFSLKMCIENVGSKNFLAHAEDIVYLEKMLDKILCGYDSDSECVKQLLKEIKIGLHNLCATPVQ